MRKNKVGSLFMVSLLALAGIGISYAGFTDEISIYGEVNTATVSMEVVDYSGTLVFKVWGEKPFPSIPGGWITPAEYDADEEVLIFRGFMDDLPTEDEVLAWADGEQDFDAELVSYAKAQEYTGTEQDADVHMIYDNLFPCKWFTADFVVKYTGSIPAKLWADINVAGSEWLEGVDVEILAFEAELIEDDAGDYWEMGDAVDIGHQVHEGDYVYLALSIHLPQDNQYQDLDGEFFANILALQWNEDPSDLDSCDPVDVDPAQE